MARTRNSASKAPKTSATQLRSIVKSARDVMRKDKGLSGDLDRLPMLTWIMFLKFLDDMENIRVVEATLADTHYQPVIVAPYRWRDWAGRPDGISGDDLKAFINQDECVRPDGSRGPGLFKYLRGLQSSDGHGREEIIATVFRGVNNRMESGYLLRDVINLINDIRFDSSEEIHVLSHLYETMLREMRDAAGDSGEFYTPRPVVQLMVAATDPRLGETVLDPACGTGGFLVEAYTHMADQCETGEDRRLLQESIVGGEAKPLPYLLGEMNLLLHGMDSPSIAYGNSLAQPLTGIGDGQRVDVILTNPPFGGEEERGILGNFPEDRQTAETTLLFLQVIMRRLRRAGAGADRGGRAAVVVPNGALFGDGVAARIKEELLKEFNLHTVVRLPNGVFAPYTNIPTNLLFFERGGPTGTIWYYEHPLPEDRKNYTKTKPLRYEEFKPLLTWWHDRHETEQAWRVSADDVLVYDDDGGVVSVNLDIKNPNSDDSFQNMPPGQLVDEIVAKEQRILILMDEIRSALAESY
ncbi:MAG: SAM-dependent DNA methyltransferase [Caldilineaceae bacterium]|nr:SAM-dependent DNA methyltransferase [Caldilineaceae bacterium]